MVYTATFTPPLPPPLRVLPARLFRGLEVVLCLLEGLLLFLAHGDVNLANPHLVSSFSRFDNSYFSSHRVDRSGPGRCVGRHVAITLRFQSFFVVAVGGGGGDDCPDLLLWWVVSQHRLRQPEMVPSTPYYTT